MFNTMLLRDVMYHDTNLLKKSKNNYTSNTCNIRNVWNTQDDSMEVYTYMTGYEMKSHDPWKHVAPQIIIKST